MVISEPFQIVFALDGCVEITAKDHVVTVSFRGASVRRVALADPSLKEVMADVAREFPTHMIVPADEFLAALRRRGFTVAD